MRTEVRLITPHLAQSFLSRTKINRKLSEKDVLFYADQMKRGQWKLTGQGISFDTDNYLIDGQHRLHAIIKSAVTLRFLIIYDVDGDTFKQYDSGKRRSTRDAFIIEGINNATQLSSGIARYDAFNKSLITTRTKETRLTSEDVLNIYYSDEDFWKKISRFGGRMYDALRLFPPSVIIGFTAFLIKTKRKPPEKVYQFMSEVFGTEPSLFRTIQLLRKTILNSEMTLKKIPMTNKVALLIKAWNAYEINRDVKILKYTPQTDAYPKVI